MLVRSSHLREVPHNVSIFAHPLHHDVEQEWLHIKVEGLVIEEELSKETETLAVVLNERG